MEGYTLFFLLLLKNIDCGYSLEPPHWGGSNEYSQSMFCAEIWKVSGILSEKFHFLVVKFSVYLIRRVFVMIVRTEFVPILKLNTICVLCRWIIRVQDCLQIWLHYENIPIQIYCKFNHQKNENFQIKNSDIFYVSAQNIDCGYSLEPPRRGGSNEYPQYMFLSRNKKNNVYPCKSQFYYIKVGFKGVKVI